MQMIVFPSRYFKSLYHFFAIIDGSLRCDVQKSGSTGVAIGEVG